MSRNLDGMQTFYVKDPHELFQIVHDDYIFKNEGRPTGGGCGATIGVTDIEKAMTIYRDILSYDTIISDETGVFPDFDDCHRAIRNLSSIKLRISKTT